MNRNIMISGVLEGIATVSFDTADSSANVFNQQNLEELNQVIAELEAQTGLKGVLFVSGKPSIFIAGADIREILKPGLTREQMENLVKMGQDVFERITRLKAVTVACIHGACLGGGFELALACDYRIASPDRSTKIGLPEVNLGILPAWGGTTRLPRLIGFPAALDMILSAKQLNAKKARKVGMIDEVVHREHFERIAFGMIARGKPKRSRRFFTNNPLSSAIVTHFAAKKLAAKTRGNYPAPEKALRVMDMGLQESMEAGLALERKAILDLGSTSVSANLVNIFFLQERSKRLSTGKFDLAPINRVEVIGAGTMGAGIAQWLASRGMTVYLRDIGPAPLFNGLQTASKLFRDAVKKAGMDPAEARQGMDRIIPVQGFMAKLPVDMVIEAAVENMGIKKKIFSELSGARGGSVLLSTNTSALSITELASGVSQSGNVVGIHFFNPVAKMPLVEVIRGEHTSAEALERSIRFVQKIGKMPVVVKDSPGFLVNRILIPYLIEAGDLYANGADPLVIDRCMLDFGMPMGPLRLIDEVGVDVASHVADFFHASFGERMPVPPLLAQMKDKNFLGRKSGLGFFQYKRNKRDGEPPVHAALNSLRTSTKYAELTPEVLCNRMVLLMVNEAARCLEENVVPDPRDVDFGMIMGTGFSPFRGGPLRYADSEGIPKICDQLNRLASSVHARFEPCRLLADMARSDTKFHADPS